ncbi:MAG: hypothetical protein ACREFE_17045 [Limisphaerales bacterium]
MNPREPFERLLDVFDDPFKRAAVEHGFVFDPGVHKVTRAIRLKDDHLKRGVFLDLKDHWMQSDPVDPAVVLNYGAWSSSHVLIKSFYDGKLSELTRCIDAKLGQAVSELMMVSETAINRDGKSLEDLRTGAVKL